MLCSCGRAQPYSTCCEPYVSGCAAAPTAEDLMRSRYTAYVTGNIDYLVATHHLSRRSQNAANQIRQTVDSTTWLGLTVVMTEDGQPGDTVGFVEFVARYVSKPSTSAKSQRGKSVAQIHERSKFIQRKGRWFYLDGDQLPPLNPKRSEPCWCGSGKKFKNCHM